MMRVRVVGIGVIALCVGLALAGGLFAERNASQIVAHQGGQPYTGTLPDELPPVPRGPMTVTPNGEAISILQFDDGTCESGLGFIGSPPPWSAVVDFDVPTQCIQAGLSIVGITAKMNTNTAISMVMFQAGASPSVGRQVVDIPDILANGPCPTNQGMTSRAIAPGVAVVFDTTNFFAGLFHAGFPGRDSSNPAGRMWMRTNTTGGTFSPAYLSSLGLGGNWMIRVTVEDQNCVPVELQSITIS